MKFRSGFVSNSSSSSFILAFDEKPDTIKELQELIFRGQDTFNSVDGDLCWPAVEIAQIVFDDLQDKKPLTKEEILEELSNGYPKNCSGMLFSMEAISQLTGNDWDAYEQMMRKNAEYILEFFEKRHLKKKYFRVIYSDSGDGERGASMEQGDLFALIPHLTISHH